MPYPTFGDPAYHPDNANNPYGYQVNDESQGLVYFNAPESNSTMVSDSVEMTRRLKMFVPASSVKKGRTPINDLMSLKQAQEENNKGDYKAKFQ